MRGEPMWQRGALYIFFLFLPCFHVGGAGILFLGWITFSLRMPASGVPNYLTAHHHYKTAHRRRLLARWALARNQGAPHGEERKSSKYVRAPIKQFSYLYFFRFCWKPGTICSLLILCTPLANARRTAKSWGLQLQKGLRTRAVFQTRIHAGNNPTQIV